MRIEAVIGQLQPLVPHYDALLAAEHALANASIELEQPHTPAAEAPGQSWEEQHKPAWEQGGESSGWNS